MLPHFSRAHRSAGLLMVVAALTVAGCSSTSRPTLIGTHGGVAVTGAVDKLSPRDVAASAAAWGARYDANPKDRDVALNYAAVLRLNNQADQAVAVPMALRQLARYWATVAAPAAVL